MFNRAGLRRGSGTRRRNAYGSREDYLPITVVSAARERATAFASPRFADEAAYVATAEEYASPALGENYLPIITVPAAHRTELPVSRIFRDELVAARQGYLTVTMSQSGASEPTISFSKPR
jgi:hypothetical protein